MTKQEMTTDLRRAYTKEIAKITGFRCYWRNFGSDSFGYEQDRDGTLLIYIETARLDDVLGMFSGDEDIEWNESTMLKDTHLVKVTFER